MTEPAKTSVLDGRYVLDRLLQRRSGIETHLGRASADGTPVVVKLIRADAASATVRLRLEHEAKVLEMLTSTAVRPMVASGKDGDLFCVVQPYHEGASLSTLLLDELPVRTVLRIGMDVAATLEAAHEAGVLHRDVKPANVIVTMEPGAERAQLIDFGFAHSALLGTAVRDELVGTVRYLAPEAAGLLDAPVDERSDLYSLGVLLFETVTGRPPSTGATVGEVLHDHVSARPPRVRSIRADVPRAFDEVIERLLRKNPDQRYQTAKAVRLDLAAIATQLDRGIVEPELTAGMHDRHLSLGEPAFVGRADEMAALRHRLESVMRGRPGLVIVESESGGGKTRLLDEFAVEAAGLGAWILRGQGVDQAAPRPFELLRGVVESILSSSDDDLLPRLLHSVGDRSAAVSAALPGLLAVMGDDSVVGPEAFGETRSIDAILSLLGGLGTAARPAVVLLDDCQWSDALTVALLRRWRELGRGHACPLLIVVAFRSEEVGPSHALRSLAALAIHPLPPFSDRDVRSLCESMAGRLPTVALDAAARLAEGSPFMAAAVLRGMVETGALQHRGGEWVVGDEEMHTVQTSQRAALFLGRRLDLLGPDAVTLLTAGAVLGKEFDIGLAVDLTGLGASAVTVALTEARRRHIVWVDEQADRCTFAHDKIRETILGRLEPDLKRALHRRAGEYIEAIDPDRIFELAYHFDAAGDDERALRYSLGAAEAARARYALDVAETHYRIALRAAVTTGASPERRAQISEGLADLLTLRGDYAEATSLLEATFDVARGPIARSSIDRKLGDLAFRNGDPAAARKHLERALSHLGRRVPRTSAGWLCALLREVTVQVLHTLLPRQFLARRSADGAAPEFAAIRIYSRLAYVYWFHSGKVACGWAHLREMNLAERYPPSSELAQAYSEHAPVTTMIPWYRRGMAYAQRSYDIRSDLGDTWGQAQSLGFHATVLYSASRYPEAIDKCRAAIELFERTGDRWEQHTAMWHLALCHYRLGDLAQAVAVARETHASATAIGDHAAAGISLSPWARASRGAIGAELVEAELARAKEDAHTGSEVRLAGALQLLAVGDLDGAASRLDDAIAMVRRAGLRQEYVAPLWPWLATARRLQYETIDAVARRRRRTALSAARRSARRAVRVARFYRNNLPHAWREHGLTLAHAGRVRRAGRSLVRSISEAERQGARYEAALSRRASAELSCALGRCATSDVDATRRAVDELEGRLEFGADVDAPESVSLLDRLAALQTAGRRIAAASSPRAVYDAVRESSIALLRGEACHVVLVADLDQNRPATDSGEQISSLSRTLIASAIRAGSPIVSGIAEEADPTESLVLSGMRSVLCAPIRCEGEIVACFYVTHEHVDGLFGNAETQLAEFISELAGASLEHMEGSEARFRSLAQNSSDVITIVDRDGAITYQSSSLQRLFGFTPDELVGTPLTDWLSPDTADDVLAFLAAARGGDESTAVLHARLRRRDGGWLDVEASATNLLSDPSVNGIVLNTRDVSDRIALEAELNERAWHDPLTGLANRALFGDRVTHALERQARDDRRIAVLFLDVDDFKSINDTMGHFVGDMLLKHLARLLEWCVRERDTVARFGGDEFAVLLEDADLKTASAIAGRIVDSFGRSVSLGGFEIFAHASIGVAMATPLDTAETLLSAADSAMYVAKANGKARYEVFAAAMRDDEIDRSGLRTALEWAVARGELRVHYQPVIDLRTGEPAGFEALVRWDHPERGQLLPAEFIEIAEQSGAIVAIGAWVLRIACHQAQQWRKTFGRDLSMSVNVSARQLQNHGLAEEIRIALRESLLEPSALILEITESATMGDNEAMIARLLELRELGVRLAIDDFGTGYSSLSHLRRFPVEMLKVDRSFVSGMVDSAEDAAIVASVISLGQTLGLSVVAEGVETVEQLECLARMGCDYGQGFNWAFPTAPIDLRGWLGMILLPPAPRSSSPVGVLLVDDLETVRSGLRMAIETDPRFAVVAEAADAEAAIVAARRHQPRLIVLDVAMPGMGGLAAVPLLRDAAPDASIVLLTAVDMASLDPFLAASVDGCYDKTNDLSSLVDSLGDVVGLPTGPEAA